MSLVKNTIANYVGQGYIVAVNLLVVPLYLRYLGREAYGLVGVFAMLQAWFLMLDIGLSPTLARQVARYRGGAITGSDLRRLLRAMEGIFYSIGLLGAVAIAAASGFIAEHWLRVEHLPVREVATSVRLMAVAVALRWIAAIYRGAIAGFEDQIWLSGFNIVIATIRPAGIVPLFAFFHLGIISFFGFHVIVTGLECAGLAWRTYRSLPSTTDRVHFSVAPLRGVVGFSMTIAFTSILWVLATQTDRLVLSKTLTLQDFGVFTLAVLLAGTINLVSSPISQALLPRLTKLAAEKDEAGLMNAYLHATQWTSTLTAPVCVMFTYFAEPIVWVWTGSRTMASAAAPVMILYSIGNGALTMGIFPFYLQYAKGNLRLHVAGTVLFLFVLLPLIVWASLTYGARGAGAAWAMHNVIFWFPWTSFVHRRLTPGIHTKWLVHRVFPSWLASETVGLIAYLSYDGHGERLRVAMSLATVGTVCAVASAITQPEVRRQGAQILTRVVRWAR